ncbi:helix-turn-helix domain-containing protein [Fulvivirga ligni]|uniref:helix-turn-helix domain-containing protein n=1 Tax=Fulvivirga ligni TaxID=2904246 RepID=UPI001F1FC12E|nr:helix-turn-helix domain-containing protein [Fulvivirga ligni]UII19027.1 helix-turn-helix domain-containing protein [Fulvivirga ligni]
MGDFSVSEIGPYNEEVNVDKPAKQSGSYKVLVLQGAGSIHYADRVMKVPGQVLIFSNPLAPYDECHFERAQNGYSATFNNEFFYEYGSLNKYPVFQPMGNHVFELSKDQLDWVISRFLKMNDEIQGSYEFKYDILKILIQELIHFAMKLKPVQIAHEPGNGADRIMAMFTELLAQQFPLHHAKPRIELRRASDFAERLNIHPNHLNRALKKTTNKTTTQLISERILMEARVLIKQTSWNVAEIAFALGFEEPTHFNNFFKKHMNTSPLLYRRCY